MFLLLRLLHSLCRYRDLELSRFPFVENSLVSDPQAAEREEEGINEVKRNFEREQMVMRTEVDQELLKINDLYDKRCRDYAQMVSDECEEEVSKATAGERRCS